MKYLDEFRDPGNIGRLHQRINELIKDRKGKISLMEVCGTHTVAIFRSGLRQILPDKVKLLSGPGCPVCVTPNNFLDKAIAYSRLENTIITTFGDLIRVPGSSSSLEREKGDRGDIRIVYSPLDALKIAGENPGKKVIFLGVGFETTTPTLAATIEDAEKQKLNNFFVLCGNKVVPPALEALGSSKEIKLDGLICPGHVSAIIGSIPYELIAERFRLPCVITGFEPVDISLGIYMLLHQIVEGKNEVEIQYTRAVKKEGNVIAKNLMDRIFETIDSNWRGIGVIPGSGLKLRKNYIKFDAEYNIPVAVEKTKEAKGCICGEILRGVKTPPECKLFRKSCSPETPVGACMVSSEGTCAAYYKYST